MRKVTLTLSAIALALSLNGAAMAKVHMPEVVSPGVTVTELAHQQPIKWVSVAEVKKKLRRPSTNGGRFYIDDTVLFSSPGFYRGKLGIFSKRFQLSEKPRILGKNEQRMG